jgi:hypothetical protein
VKTGSLNQEGRDIGLCNDWSGTVARRCDTRMTRGQQTAFIENGWLPTPDSFEQPCDQQSQAADSGQLMEQPGDQPGQLGITDSEQLPAAGRSATPNGQLRTAYGAAGRSALNG